MLLELLAERVQRGELLRVVITRDRRLREEEVHGRAAITGPENLFGRTRDRAFRRLAETAVENGDDDVRFIGELRVDHLLRVALAGQRYRSQLPAQREQMNLAPHRVIAVPAAYGVLHHIAAVSPGDAMRTLSVRVWMAMAAG
ncbi:hypothetical protein ACTMTU_12540 [Streptomyces sp. OZ13]|uniref:hypothetical protein n=1 Tax=Streptomyces sp. OZ13 TaxID=3452210 RepID=UPI003F8A266C